MYIAAQRHGLEHGEEYTLLTESWAGDNEQYTTTVYSSAGVAIPYWTTLDGSGTTRDKQVLDRDAPVNYVVNFQRPETGRKFYFRAAAVTDDYNGPFFDAFTPGGERVRHRWEGTPFRSATVVETISRERCKGVYFGTEERMLWLPSPAVDLSMPSRGYSTSTTFLNGGAYVRKSANKHKTYSFNWSMLSSEQLRPIKAFDDGLYGQGPYYFLLPGTMDNILPQAWAVPRIACDDGIPLVEGPRPRAMSAQGSIHGYPTTSAHYDIPDEEARREVMTLPVPENLVLHLGVHGAFSGTARMVYAVDGGEPKALNPLSTDTPQLTNAMVSGPAMVTLWLAGTGTATLNSMVAAARNSFYAPEGEFPLGQGHSGVQFANEDGVALTMYSAVKDKWHASAEFVEVGQWL